MAVLGYVLLPLLGAFLTHFFILPAFSSPLANIPPAHWSARFSSIWILWARFRRRENRTIHAAHLRLGPTVRLGPSEISVNDLQGIKTIYTGGWEKPSWYLLFTNYGGVTNMFTMLGSHAHSQRKRQLSNIYAKSYLQRAPAMVSVVEGVIKRRFLKLVARAAYVGEGVEIYDLLSRMAMDVISGYMFGQSNGTQMLESPKNFHKLMKVYVERGKHAFVSQEMPGVLRVAKLLSLPPYTLQVINAKEQVDKFCADLCKSTNERIESGQLGDEEAVVYKQLSKLDGVQEETHADETLGTSTQIASELLDHLLAGFETTAIALTYAMYQLSSQPVVQRQLRDELRSLPTPFTNAAEAPIPSSTEIDRLPFLNAVLMETLRLNASIPGPQPRVSPEGAFINGHGPLPSGVRASAQAYSLHRNPDVFADPERWDPQRWVRGDKLPEMAKWFWAFSSGGRMCIGSNLALLESKMALAAVYTNFETEVEDASGIEQEDAYTAGPSGEVWLSFRQLRGNNKEGSEWTTTRADSGSVKYRKVP